MHFRNVIFALCVIACAVHGEDRRIWSNAAYGKADPREWLPESLYTNCVAWYTMNQNPAQFAAWGVPDGSAIKISGGQTNANSRPSWIDANQGYLTFDGIDDAVDIGDQTYLDGKTAMSISAWVYATTNVANQSVFSKFLTTGNQRCVWLRVYYDPSPSYHWNLIIYTDGGSTSFSSKRVFEAITLNAWTHLVFTWSAPDTIVAYVNGVSKTLSSLSGGTAPSAIFSSSSLYQIGNSQSSATAFRGGVGDVDVFNRAITATEATNLFLRSKAVYGL